MTVAYETWGTLAPDASNAVLVLHALTGDSHAAGPSGPGHGDVGWWDGTIGPGGPIRIGNKAFRVLWTLVGGLQRFVGGEVLRAVVREAERDRGP